MADDEANDGRPRGKGAVNPYIRLGAILNHIDEIIISQGIYTTTILDALEKTVNFSEEDKGKLKEAQDRFMNDVDKYWKLKDELEDAALAAKGANDGGSDGQ